MIDRVRGAGLSGCVAWLPVQAVWAVAVQWPLVHTDGVAFLVANVLVAAAFPVTGLVIGADVDHRGTARALHVAGFVWPLNWINEWSVGPLPLIAALVGPLASVVAAWALLRYPVPWRRPWQDRAVAAVLALVQLLAVAVVLVSPPDRSGAAPVWIALWPSWPAYRVLSEVYEIGGAVVAIAVLVGVLARFRRLRGPDRRAMRAVVAAVGLAAALAALADAARGAGVPDPVVHHLYLAESAALVMVSLAFLLAALDRWFTVGGLPDLAVALRAAQDGADVQNLLRTALDDPGLRVLYDDGAGTLVDVAGCPLDAADPPRDALPLTSSRGTLLGVVLVDPAFRRRHTARLDPILRIAVRALESTRLQTLVQARVCETTASATRLAELVALEERRIVDDLRKGPLRRLEVACRLLDDVVGRADEDVAAQLVEVRAAARAAVRDIGDLAQGRAPAVLVADGLGVAVRAAVPPEVGVDLPADRFGAAAETAAYFSVVELVTNAVKHADARTIRVVGTSTAEGLVAAVIDDGRGGVDPSGLGLDGVASRLAAVGGELRIDSTRGSGTTASFVLPRDDARDQRRSSSRSGGLASISGPASGRPSL